MPNAAAVYCRISKDQGTALGVARQRRDCLAWCEARGWAVADVLTDNDVSAYSGKRRPEYERLLAGVRDGVFDAIVAWHPDRLHREPRELEDFITLVETSGVDVGIVTTGDYDLSTPEGRLTARIVGSVARKESEDKSRRLRRKHLELAEAGAVSGGGRRPFGFEPDRVTIRESEAVEVRSAVARLVAGESLRSITMDWQRRGVPTVTGAAWSATTVRRLLTSARISGQREHRGVMVDAVWPAIVEPADTLRARAAVAALPFRDHGVRARTNLLTGLLVCGRCGRAMSSGAVMSRGTRYARYVCPKDRGGCGNGASVPKVDDLVFELLARWCESTTGKRTAARPSKAPDPLAKLLELDRRASDAGEMFAAGQITREVFAQTSASIAARRAVVELEVAEHGRVSTPTWLGRGAELRQLWDVQSVGWRRATVASMLAGPITVAPSQPGATRFVDDRIGVTWRS